MINLLLPSMSHMSDPICMHQQCECLCDGSGDREPLVKHKLHQSMADSNGSSASLDGSSPSLDQEASDHSQVESCTRLIATPSV
jgi:hypothetical protein